MPRGYSSKGANTSRAKAAPKKPAEQIRDWKYNAQEYADIKSGDGWVFARLVACSVRPGTGSGAAGHEDKRANLHTSKISANTFAKAAHVSPNTVLTYLELWKAAYQDQDIPEVWIDPDKCEPWQAADDELELPKVDFKTYRAERRVLTLVAPILESEQAETHKAQTADVIRVPIEDRPLTEPPKPATKGTSKAVTAKPNKPPAGLVFSDPPDEPQDTATPLQNVPNKIDAMVPPDVPVDVAAPPVKLSGGKSKPADDETPLRDFMLKRFNEWDTFTESLVREANKAELEAFVSHLREVADQIADRI